MGCTLLGTTALYSAGTPFSLCTYESTRKPSGSYCRQSIHLACDPIFVGASRIAKQVCVALEVTPDFGGEGADGATRCCYGCCQTKNLGCEAGAATEKRTVQKTVSGESKNLRNREGFPSRLSFHRNRLQFEMSADQQRPRSDEFPRRIVLCCKVARINRVESSKK